jgi:hypothetical protein
LDGAERADGRAVDATYEQSDYRPERQPYDRADNDCGHQLHTLEDGSYAEGKIVAEHDKYRACHNHPYKSYLLVHTIYKSNSKITRCKSSYLILYDKK